MKIATTILFLGFLAMCQSQDMTEPPETTTIESDILERPVFPEEFPSPAIINGERANQGEIPYQAALLFQTASGTNICGGSLIRPNWVLTAAHCIAGSRTQVRLGSTNLNNMTYVQFAAQRIVHENYNPNNFNNDVALLRLPTAATGPGIGIVAVAPSNTGSLQDQTVRASGYGFVTNQGPTSENLMKVNLRVISNSECQQTFGNSIISSTMCTTFATQQGQSACSGDSGGPLVLRSGGQDVLVGAVSFGASRGCTTAPVAFARLSSFRNWIDTNIARNS